MKSYIGTVLEYYEHTFLHTVGAWERQLMPQIEEMARQFTQLELGPFTQGVFEDILAHQTHNIRSQYEAIVQQDIRGYKTAVARDTVLHNLDAYILPLEKSIRELLARKEKAQGYALTGQLPLEWADCTIVDGRPVLNKEQVRRRCEVAIQTEEESALYHHLLAVQKAWDSLRTHLVERGFDTRRQPIYGNTGLLVEDRDGGLVLLPQAIKGL